MEWSFFVPAVDSQSSNALRPNWVSPRSPFRPGTLTWQARLLAFEQAWCSRAKRLVSHLVLSHAPRLCPVCGCITMLTRRKLRLEEVYSERLFQKHFQRQLLISAMSFLKLSRFLNPKQLRFRLLILRFIPSTGPLEKSYSTLLRTAVMFFFKVEMAVSMF